jgi:thiosulfate/3-mercaptopyruvate sulfurtransferase
MDDDVRPMSERELPPIVTIDSIAHDDDIIFCDVRWYLDRTPGRQKFNEGHLPGAIFVDLDEHLATLPQKTQGRHPMPAAASFAASMGALGISHQDRVVAYDDSGGMSAGRLVWMLRILGQQAALLDGGLHAWSGDLEAGPRDRQAVDHPIRPWPPRLLVDADEAAVAGTDPKRVLIDSRNPDRYFGDNEPVDPQAGHIPGAINLPFGDNLTGDGWFRTPQQLRAHFEEAGLVDGDVPVMYCGSGVSACNNLLAFEHAGLGQAVLYAGSWSQWSNDQDRPVETT